MKGIAIVVTSLVVVFAAALPARASSYSDLADNLAIKYNLKSGDVEKFIVHYYAQKNDDEDTTTMFAEHLKFIEKKLNAGVTQGELTKEQKKAVMTKLKKMMDKGPSAAQYRKMSDDELKDRINAWKKEMSVWAKKNGLTLAQLRDLTGKGNKYFMGIELDK